MNLEEEIERIVYNTNNFWTDLEKARYVYIEVGKIVEKNTEFFLTQAKKLQKNALSKQEMERIHDVSENMFDSDDWYRIICRSGAKLLKIIYDRLNIDCHMVKSLDYLRLNQEDKVKVYHWILSLDIDNKHYALTISHDLPNIKNKFKTEHFGCKYPKITPRGVEQYEGEDLNFAEIDPKELERIDYKIGYITSHYNTGKNSTKPAYDDLALDIIRKDLIGNKSFYEIIVKQTSIYKNMFALTDGNDNETNATAIQIETLFTEYYQQLVKNVCTEVEKNLHKNLGIDTPVLKFQDPNTWLRQICTLLKEDLIETYGEENKQLFEVKEDFDYKKWRMAQKNLVCPYKHYENNLQLLDQVVSYIEILTRLNQMYRKGTIKSEDLKLIKRLRSLHSSISMHFLPERTVFEKNIEIVNGKPYIKSNYINEKFKTLFPMVFSANINIQDFNNLSYSEQIHCLTKIIPYLFDELTVKNCEQAAEYNYYCKPALNRIRLYTLFNEKTNNYEIIFHIPSFYDFEDEFYYRYELKENKFTQIDIIEDVFNNKDYEIISTSLREKFKENERENVIFDELMESKPQAYKI